MKTVLPDTNIILWTFNNGPHFKEEIERIAPHYKIMIPSCIISELKKLNNKQSRAALQLCENIETINIGEGYADKMLITAAKKGYLIATNDNEILKELKEEKINALRIREKNKLMYTEGEI